MRGVFVILEQGGNFLDRRENEFLFLSWDRVNDNGLFDIIGFPDIQIQISNATVIIIFVLFNFNTGNLGLRMVDFFHLT